MNVARQTQDASLVLVAFPATSGRCRKIYVLYKDLAWDMQGGISSTVFRAYSAEREINVAAIVTSVCLRMKHYVMVLSILGAAYISNLYRAVCQIKCHNFIIVLLLLAFGYNSR